MWYILQQLNFMQCQEKMIWFPILWFYLRLCFQLRDISGFCLEGIIRIKSCVFLTIIMYITQWNNYELFYVRWRYSTLSNTTFIHFFYYIQFCKVLIVFFYDDDTVDIGYNKQVVDVDNTMYHVFHNIHW